MISERTVFFSVKPLRVFGRQHGVRRGMIVYHVDYAFHAFFMNGFCQRPEIIQSSVLRVDRAVIADGIRRTKAPFPAFLPDGVDRKKIDDVHPQVPDPVEVPSDAVKCAFLRVIAHKDLVHQLVSEFLFCLICHG